MTDVEPVVTDFAATGRAGRRNALPDILGSPAGTATADLPDKLSELSVSGKYEAASSRETKLAQTAFCSQMLCIQCRIHRRKAASPANEGGHISSGLRLRPRPWVLMLENESNVYEDLWEDTVSLCSA
nr:PREDICTED: cAMP-dependent protein kinase inhibitor beta [Lepisosteus oculatus]